MALARLKNKERNKKGLVRIMTRLRLDKYLAEMGCGTRSQVKTAIRKGRVKVNNKTIKSPEQKVNTKTDRVFLDEAEVSYVAMEYYMLNKPAGVVSAREDGRYPTVVELIDQKQRNDLFPVGRLDLDTEGLLLITNDGILCHELLSPKKHVEKTYYVEVDKEIPDKAVTQFQQGVDIGEEKLTLPAQLEILTKTTARLTIQEGKFHQVKRMFKTVGTNVVYLKRLSMGKLVLDPSLPCGQYRPLTESEIRLLKGECL